MDLDKITKTQLIKKLVEQHRKIQSLETRLHKSPDISYTPSQNELDSSESLLRTNSIGLMTIDKKGIITSCNDALLEFLGYKRDELIGKYYTSKVSINTRDMSKYISMFRDVLNGRESSPFEISHRHTDGSLRYGEVYFGPVMDRAMELNGFKVIIKDTTRQKEYERRSQDTSREAGSLIKSSLDGVVIHDNGIIIEANRAFADMFNFEYEDLEGKYILDFISDDCRDMFSARLIDNETEQVEIEGKKSTGNRVYIETSGDKIMHEGRELRVDIFHDINELKKSEKKIKYLKFHDSLTTLYNRTYMEKVIKNVYNDRNIPLNFIICDMNGLKLVNDAFGYEEGDMLLKRVAKILKYCCRKEDIIARWGGDEFFILLPRSTPAETRRITYKIKDICANTLDQKIPLNISVGTAFRDDSSRDFSEFIKEAEDNMYTNKLLERKSISNSILASLERMLWEKSHETRDHAERLKDLILKMGEIINLPQNKLDELVLLSTLHDIGKIAIPDSILSKKGRLNKQEWKVIRRHPEIGYNIANSNPQLAIVADDILSHHEWWDGSGYPQGLKGDEIPINSCITSIVDAFDVMVSGRPYKEPVSVEEAKKELQKWAGSQFSPYLVEKFVNYC